MKTVGERIRQARTFRGMSGEELSLKVGYKTQSGISNLENRATGRGGFQLPKIAEVLDFAVEWFLDGPDTDDMRNVNPYAKKYSISPVKPAVHIAAEAVKQAYEYTWPFQKITQAQWFAIPTTEREFLELQIESVALRHEGFGKVQTG